jgi:hypothetical protein
MCLAINNHHATLAEAPELGPYVREALRLRNELSDYLWDGRFRDTVGARIVSEEGNIRLGVHEHRTTGRRAYVLANFGETVDRAQLYPDQAAPSYTKFEPFGGPKVHAIQDPIEIQAARLAIVVEE